METKNTPQTLPPGMESNIKSVSPAGDTITTTNSKSNMINCDKDASCGDARSAVDETRTEKTVSSDEMIDEPENQKTGNYSSMGILNGSVCPTVGNHPDPVPSNQTSTPTTTGEEQHPVVKAPLGELWARSRIFS